jgi:hypothetical protein
MCGTFNTSTICSFRKHTNTCPARLRGDLNEVFTTTPIESTSELQLSNTIENTPISTVPYERLHPTSHDSFSDPNIIRPCRMFLYQITRTVQYMYTDALYIKGYIVSALSVAQHDAPRQPRRRT